MKTRFVVMTFTSSLLSFAIVLSTSSLAATQEPEANTAVQRDATTNQTREAHPSAATEDDVREQNTSGANGQQ